MCVCVCVCMRMHGKRDTGHERSGYVRLSVSCEINCAEYACELSMFAITYPCDLCFFNI